MAKLARTRRPRLTPAAMQRALRADRWVPRFARAIRKALDRQVREVARELRAGTVPGQESHVLGWTHEMENVQRPWMIAMSAEGYDLAGTEFGLKSADALGKATVDPVTAGVGASFLQVGDYDSIDRWVATTAAGSSATTARQMEGVYKDAAASRDPETGRAWTNRDIAKQIERKGLARNATRALMLARTGSIWSMNEGAQQRYGKMGVTVVRWDSTLDSARCPFCAQMHGRVVRLNDPFWKRGSTFGVQVPRIGGGLSRRTLKLPHEVQHPPLHPNCRCTLVPVITQEQAQLITPPGVAQLERQIAEPEHFEPPAGFEPMDRQQALLSSKLKLLQVARRMGIPYADAMNKFQLVQSVSDPARVDKIVQGIIKRQGGKSPLTKPLKPVKPGPKPPNLPSVPSDQSAESIIDDMLKRGDTKMSKVPDQFREELAEFPKEMLNLAHRDGYQIAYKPTKLVKIPGEPSVTGWENSELRQIATAKEGVAKRNIHHEFGHATETLLNRHGLISSEDRLAARRAYKQARKKAEDIVRNVYHRKWKTNEQFYFKSLEIPSKELPTHTHYALLDFDEFWADGVRAYMRPTSAKTLLQRQPKLYDIIKRNVFRGKEFI